MAGDFVQLDTSGEVRRPETRDAPSRRWLWSDLDPFTQGYIEALLQPTEAMFYTLTSRHAGFSDLAPETLDAIRRDCKRDQEIGERIGSREDRTSREAGRRYWLERQTGNLFDAPPVTVALSDAGKVVFA